MLTVPSLLTMEIDILMGAPVLHGIDLPGMQEDSISGAMNLDFDSFVSNQVRFETQIRESVLVDGAH